MANMELWEHIKRSEKKACDYEFVEKPRRIFR